MVARYLYEHLFLGHLYFKDVSTTNFFTIVRSKTPPGQPIKLISTVCPYNDSGINIFYYRLRHHNRVIVDKTHLPYALTDKRMARFNSLFLKPEYHVKALPSYEVKLAANPFKTFSVISAKSRYQFMLDEAQFFVGGFIKGAVCRGSIALNEQSLVPSEKSRVRDEDTIDIVSGFVGAYPNFFLEVNYSDLALFVEQYKKIETFEQYDQLVVKFGVRRTNFNFWQSADWFYKKHQHDNKVYAGLFDLNCYKIDKKYYEARIRKK